MPPLPTSTGEKRKRTRDNVIEDIETSPLTKRRREDMSPDSQKEISDILETASRASNNEVIDVDALWARHEWLDKYQKRGDELSDSRAAMQYGQKMRLHVTVGDWAGDIHEIIKKGEDKIAARIADDYAAAQGEERKSDFATINAR